MAKRFKSKKLLLAALAVVAVAALALFTVCTDGEETGSTDIVNCMLPDSTCSAKTRDGCAADGGEVVSYCPGSSCTQGQNCAEDMIKCLLPNSTCGDMRRDQCGYQSGTVVTSCPTGSNCTAGTDCPDDQVKCKLSEESCTETTREGCSGEVVPSCPMKGDDDCTPALNCPDDRISCDMQGGSCNDNVTRKSCLEGGHEVRSTPCPTTDPGDSCKPNIDCPSDRVACVFFNGGTCGTVTRVQCQGNGQVLTTGCPPDTGNGGGEEREFCDYDYGCSWISSETGRNACKTSGYGIYGNEACSGTMIEPGGKSYNPKAGEFYKDGSTCKMVDKYSEESYPNTHPTAAACYADEEDIVAPYCLWDVCARIHDLNAIDPSGNGTLTYKQNCETNSKTKTVYNSLFACRAAQEEWNSSDKYFCQWGTAAAPTGCHMFSPTGTDLLTEPTDTKYANNLAKCHGDGRVYMNSTVEGDGQGCTGTFVAPPTTPGGGTPGGGTPGGGTGDATATHCRYDGDPSNCWTFGGTTPDAAACRTNGGEPVSDCNAAGDGVWCDWGAAGGCYFITDTVDSETGTNYASPSAKCTGTTGVVSSLGNPSRCTPQ